METKLVKSTTIGNLTKALALAKLKFGKIQKDAKSHNNSYVTLDNLINQTEEALSHTGLVIMQFPSECSEQVELITLISHESGEFIECSCKAPRAKLPKENAIQELGSTITYLKRYTMGALLGISIDTDDDGNKTTVENKSSQKKEEVVNDNEVVYVVKGNSFPINSKLKELGFRFDSASKSWYIKLNNDESVINSLKGKFELFAGDCTLVQVK